MKGTWRCLIGEEEGTQNTGKSERKTDQKLRLRWIIATLKIKRPNRESHETDTGYWQNTAWPSKAKASG